MTVQFYSKKKGVKKGAAEGAWVGAITVVVTLAVSWGMMKEEDGKTIVESIPTLIVVLAATISAIHGIGKYIRNWVKVTRGSD